MANAAEFNNLNDSTSDHSPFSRVFQHRFQDVDELASSLREGNVTLTQLSLQPFQSDITALFLDEIQVSFTRLNCPVRVVGNKTTEVLCFVLLPHGINHPVISHGRPITSDYIYGFDLNRGVNQVFPAHTTHCSITVCPDLFATCAEVMNRPDLNADYFAPNFAYLPETLPPLQAYLKQLYALLQQSSPLLQQSRFQQLIVQDFLPLLVSALPIQSERLKLPIQPFQRARLVQQAEDYMLAHLHQPLTLIHLCKALGTSSRALSYGFQELFGLSPMAYLKILRLQGVHRKLKTANSATQTIANIANQFGFWSLSHFSRDYKQVFGELPSETFKR